MTKVKNFKVIISQDEDGVFVVSVPSLPGCHTQGDTYEEAISNIKEAIELCVEVASKEPKYNSILNEKESHEDRFVGIADISVPMVAV